MNTTNIRRRIHPKNSFGIVVLSKDVLLVERELWACLQFFSVFNTLKRRFD